MIKGAFPRTSSLTSLATIDRRVLVVDSERRSSVGVQATGRGSRHSARLCRTTHRTQSCLATARLCSDPVLGNTIVVVASTHDARRSRNLHYLAGIKVHRPGRYHPDLVTCQDMRRASQGFVLFVLFLFIAFFGDLICQQVHCSSR